VHNRADGREGDLGKDHAVYEKAAKVEPATIHSHLHNALKDVVTEGMGFPGYTGMPTHKVWETSLLGNTKVFYRPPKLKANLVIGVDLSGSMGCWCDGCNRYDDCRDNGWYAWQVTAAITTRFPNAVVFGFSTGDGRHLNKDQITLMPRGVGGLRLICRNEEHVPGGNPDCVGLMYLGELVGGDFQNTRAIFVSDGEPSGSSNPSINSEAHLIRHTRELAFRYHEEGMRFASVLISEDANETLYPASVTLRVNSEADLADIGKVFEFFEGV